MLETYLLKQEQQSPNLEEEAKAVSVMTMTSMIKIKAKEMLTMDMAEEETEVMIEMIETGRATEVNMTVQKRRETEVLKEDKTTDTGSKPGTRMMIIEAFTTFTSTQKIQLQPQIM